MNIFVVDADPIKAAQSLCDAHVVKMIVETCQLLSTQDRLDGNNEGRYKMTHVNHPCRKCLKNEWNKSWLELHLFGLLQEYFLRYGKTHKCIHMFRSLWSWDAGAAYMLNKQEGVLSWIALTTLPQCMPEKFKVSSDIPGYVPCIGETVLAYRNYYRYKARTLKRFTYTKREPPEWLKGSL